MIATYLADPSQGSATKRLETELEKEYPNSKLEYLKMRDQRGSSLLQVAAYNGYTRLIGIAFDELSQCEILKLLKDGNPTPLHNAAQCGHQTTAEAILAPLSPDQQSELISLQCNRKTAIEAAADRGYVDIANVLLQCKQSAGIYIYNFLFLISILLLLQWLL